MNRLLLPETFVAGGMTSYDQPDGLGITVFRGMFRDGEDLIFTSDMLNHLDVHVNDDEVSDPERSTWENSVLTALNDMVFNATISPNQDLI